MSIQLKTDQSLNTAGQVTNGILANGAMLLGMSPVFVTKNSLQKGLGLPSPVNWYNGFGANCLGILPAQGVAFAVKQVAGEHLPAQYTPFVSALASAPFAGYFERIAIIQDDAKAKEKVSLTIKSAMLKIICCVVSYVLFSNHFPVKNQNKFDF